MRQRAFRDSSPTISHDAKQPEDEKALRNPHLLALGFETENLFPEIRGPGGAIDFFRERDIKWWKSSRSGDDSQADGPTRNMASSQVACVNFLLPLAEIPGALTSMLRAVDRDVQTVVDIRHETRTSPVEFEWLGLCRSLEGGNTRGAQNTSVDAFLMAETTCGRRRAYLLEWKYTEQYLRTEPDFKGRGKAGDTRRKRYEDLFGAQTSSFDPIRAAVLDDFLYEPFYQIMRQRLLADRIVKDRELNADEAKVIVVVPEGNRAYRAVTHGKATTSPPLVRRFPQLRTVEAVMQASLKDPDTQFGVIAPSLLLESVVNSVPDDTVEWADYWKKRYGV